MRGDFFFSFFLLSLLFCDGASYSRRFRFYDGHGVGRSLPGCFGAFRVGRYEDERNHVRVRSARVFFGASVV